MFLALLGGIVFFFHLATYPYLAFAFVGSFVIHVRSAEGGTRCIAGAVLAGVAYCMVYLAAGRPFEWQYSCGFLGVGSIAVLGLVALWRGRPLSQSERETWNIAIAFPLFLLCSGVVLAFTRLIHPATLDAYLYAFDGGLGFQPSFAVGRLLRSSAILQHIALFSYESLPLAMALAFSLERRARGPYTADLLKGFVAAAIAGYFLYNWFPAVGPVHIFHELFPYSPPATPAALAPILHPDDPRNTMPSVHMAMALLICWHSRSWSRVLRACAGALVILTALATLGFGEHYLIDLVVAVPFALVMESIATTGLTWRSPVRLASCFAGTFLVLGWIVYLRYLLPAYHFAAPVLWCALAITLVCAAILECSLHHAARA